MEVKDTSKSREKYFSTFSFILLNKINIPYPRNEVSIKFYSNILFVLILSKEQTKPILHQNLKLCSGQGI
jgi:hypothetical protein